MGAVTLHNGPPSSTPSSLSSSLSKTRVVIRSDSGAVYLPPLPASVAFLTRAKAQAHGAGRPAAESSAYAKGEHYRELAERARTKLRRISVDGIATARASACSSFARPIHRELEETRKFLSELSIATAQPQTTQSSTTAGIDSAVSGTLARIDQMRRDFERKRKEEELARKKAEEDKRKAEEDRKKEEQRKADEAKAMARQEKQRLELQAAEAKKKAAAEREAAQQAKATAAAAQSQARQVSPEALEWATKYRNMYRELMDGLAVRIKGNVGARNYCSKQRGIITVKVGQLRGNMEFINKAVGTIAAILDESAQLHGAEAQEWILNLVAKIVVKQAEKEVSALLRVAYPLAMATVLLMQRYPRLVDMLLIRLVKKCPYAVPQFFPKKDSQTPEEYLLTIGYKEKDDDQLESEEAFMDRMNGMLALFAAVTQTRPMNGQPNPLPVSYAWSWLARMLNLPPRPISPLLVKTLLSIAGTSLQAAYGRQFKKAMDLLATDWIPAIAPSGSNAVVHKSNLTTFVDTYRQTGKLDECEGRVIKLV
ncbi:hypothetical protein LPJ75_000463 [Coemansia sp. RSA 2598]|nr:hypothetical protein LPJ75_000463 [Coemansia sp. RSA 2598]